MATDGRGCFYCRNHVDNPTWKPGSAPDHDPVPRHLCGIGLDNTKIDTIQDVIACPKGDPQFGFQIGGYYRHMHFEGSVPQFFPGGSRIGGCLEWYIEGDEEFPHVGNGFNFHLCEWEQLEEWVEFWGKELRRRGWVPPKE